MGNLFSYYSLFRKESFNEEFFRKSKALNHKSVDNTKIKETLDNYNCDDTLILPYCYSLLKQVYDTLPEFKITPRGGFRKRFRKFYKPQIDIDKMECIMESENKNFSFFYFFGDISLPENTFMSEEKITQEEFDTSFKNGIFKKDFMRLSKRFFGSIPKVHTQKLINMFNQMIYGDKENIDKHAIGLSYLIYKEAKNGPMDEYKSYRTIITIPNIVNHFHRILAIRFNDYFLGNNLIDTEINKGSIPGIRYPLLEQILKVRHLVKDRNNHIMFIDISNAFPSLNLPGALQLLREYKVDKNIIEYIESYYNSLEYKTHICRGEVTGFKKWGQGLVQGCPMSPIIFIIVMNYVLQRINKKYLKNCGSSIEGSKILFCAYLDDVCISCKSLEALEEVFLELKKDLSKFNLEINDRKTKVISSQRNLLQEYERVSEFKYLGETIENGNDFSSIYKNIFKTLFKRLYRIHKATYSNETKISCYKFYVLPWIQKKMIVYHDMPSELKINIRKVVFYYVRKWMQDEEETKIGFERTLRETLSYSRDRYTRSLLQNELIKERDEEILESNAWLTRIRLPLSFEY